jgi:DNA repair photolyase
MTRDEFVNGAAPRKDILTRLQASALHREAEGKAGQVLLCFTCDPYQPQEAQAGITRRAIEILHDTGHTVNILTKAGQLPRRDFDLLGPGDAFAVTLTCLGNWNQMVWESNSGTTEERLALLREAHCQGIHTWASFEPVIYPEDTLALIRKAAPYIDECKVGKLNYQALAHPPDWKDFVDQAIRLLDSLGLPYLMKQDTLKAARRI